MNGLRVPAGQEARAPDCVGTQHFTNSVLHATAIRQSASRKSPIMDALSIATIIPLPLVAATATILLEILAPRSLEEIVLLFQTRSQHIGSLSAVVRLHDQMSRHNPVLV